MLFKDSVTSAISSIKSNATRSFLTSLAIIIGTAAVISVIGLGSSANEALEQSIDDLGGRTLYVSPGQNRRGAVTKGLIPLDIKDSYVTFKNNEAWLIGTKIDPPASLKNFDADPTRSRKLLLHKKEISQLQKLKGEKGLTVVLTSIYWKENNIKCDIATGKGKKLYDQRQDIKKRDWERDQGRILKNSRK